MDLSLMPLGKAPAKLDRRTLKIENYLPKIVAPRTCDFGARLKTSWGMFGNNKYGDCVYASQAHKVQIDTSILGATVKLPTDTVLAAYSRDTGFQKDDPSTDNGAVMLDALKSWRKYGIGGHKILAFASVNIKDRNIARLACYLFGGIYMGYALPLTAQSQEVWSYVPNSIDARPGSWGGHAAWAYGYAPGFRKIVTWGAAKDVTPVFDESYCDEAFVAISEQFSRESLTSKKHPAYGFDLPKLLEDLRSVTR